MTGSSPVVTSAGIPEQSDSALEMVDNPSPHDGSDSQDGDGISDNVEPKEFIISAPESEDITENKTTHTDVPEAGLSLMIFLKI